MWEPNRKRVEDSAGMGLVLDIGGWADPLPRADYVMDVFPYETRDLCYHGIGSLPCTVTYPSPREGERFSRDTWVIHDICGSKPFPFPDKMFDFVVCSHTLEDIRDPLRVCAEIIRVGRAGYIETPSRLWEQTRRPSGIVGEGHHRWMVEIRGSHVAFYGKPHFLHTNRKYFVPHTFVEREKKEEDKIAFLFWKDGFTFEEPTTYWNAEVESFVRSLNIPRTYYTQDRVKELRMRWWRLESAVLRAFRRTQPKLNAEPLWTMERLFEANARLLSGR